MCPHCVAFPSLSVNKASLHSLTPKPCNPSSCLLRIMMYQMLSQNIFKFPYSSFSSRSFCLVYKCLTISCHICICIYTYVCVSPLVPILPPYSALCLPSFQLSILKECIFHLHLSTSLIRHFHHSGFYLNLRRVHPVDKSMASV